MLAATVVAVAATAQDWAKERVDKSPRHLEWVSVKRGDRDVKSFIAFPEVKDKATAVVVIHEIFGLSDWVQSVTDQFAEAGYIAIAPDLLSGKAPNGGGTKELGRDVRRAISELKPDEIVKDLDAVVEHVAKLPACNGKVVVTGFCWGGGQAFRFAANNRKIKAALPFYGSWPHREDELNRIACPVYGFYGGNDARINKTIPESERLMKSLGKVYEPVIYEDAGHGFMRAGDDPAAAPANKKGRDDAWKRIKSILTKI
jgi:carboxymethylenebutenolidase